MYKQLFFFFRYIRDHGDDQYRKGGGKFYQVWFRNPGTYKQKKNPFHNNNFTGKNEKYKTTFIINNVTCSPVFRVTIHLSGSKAIALVCNQSAFLGMTFDIFLPELAKFAIPAPTSVHIG